MTPSRTDTDVRRSVGAAVVAALVGAVVVYAVYGVVTVAGDAASTGALLNFNGLLTALGLSVAFFGPFLFAVLLVVGERPDWQTVAGGAVLVYAFDLLLAFVQGKLFSTSFEYTAAMLVLPLERVVAFLAIATAVWVAFGGGYERLTEPFEGPPHPLLGIVGETTVDPDFDLGRGLLAALLAALVQALGLVAAGALHGAVTAEPSGISVSFASVSAVGISVSGVPLEVLSAASFLLAVLFVVGPRLRPRDLLKGLALVVCVQAGAGIVPAVLSSRSVDLLALDGPLLAPLGDAVLLIALAVAVALAFHDSFEVLREKAPATRPGGEVRKS